MKHLADQRAPKPDLRKRHKAAVACLRCKLTKRKCDDFRPCSHCIGLGLVQECVDDIRQRPQEPSVTTLPQTATSCNIICGPSTAPYLATELDWLLELSISQGCTSNEVCSICGLPMPVPVECNNASIANNLHYFRQRLRRAKFNMVMLGLIWYEY